MSKIIETKEFVRFEVCIQGVFGRNRKPKSMYVRLADYPKLITYEGEIVPDYASIRAMVQDALTTNKVKSGAKWHVIAFPVSRDVYDDGVHIEKVLLALSPMSLMSDTVA